MKKNLRKHTKDSWSDWDETECLRPDETIGSPFKRGKSVAEMVVDRLRVFDKVLMGIYDKKLKAY